MIQAVFYRELVSDIAIRFANTVFLIKRQPRQRLFLIILNAIHIRFSALCRPHGSHILRGLGLAILVDRRC